MQRKTCHAPYRATLQHDSSIFTNSLFVGFLHYRAYGVAVLGSSPIRYNIAACEITVSCSSNVFAKWNTILFNLLCFPGSRIYFKLGLLLKTTICSKKSKLVSLRVVPFLKGRQTLKPYLCTLITDVNMLKSMPPGVL